MADSELLVAVAAHGLAGSRTDLPDASLTPIEWFDLVRACAADDLVGFLARAAADGAFPATDAQAEELSVLDAEHAGLSLLVERRALTMASLLAAAGVPYALVDGPARRLAYGDVAARQCRAVQILVPPSRLDAARVLLGRPAAAASGGVARQERLVLRTSLAGAALGASGPGAVGDPRGGGVPPGSSPVGDTTRDVEVRRAAVDGRSAGASGRNGAVPDEGRAPNPPAPPRPGDRSDAADPFGELGDAAVIDVADRAVSVLTVEQQLVVACIDLADALVVPLAHLRDVAQLALSPDLDGRQARRLAQRLGAAPALARVVALAWDTFDLADLTELSVWALRLAGAPSGHASDAAGRGRTPVGLARRLLGRRQPSPAVASLQVAAPALSPDAGTAGTAPAQSALAPPTRSR